MKCGLVWLRRDLRLHDNVALYEALRRCDRICVAFVLHRELLRSDRMGAPIVQAFFDALHGMRASLRALGSDLALLEGDFAPQLIALARRVDATYVYFNEDYEPAAIRRDTSVADALASAEIQPRAYLDHVYFGAAEVVQNAGTPYRIFTPYRNRWLDQRRLAPRSPVPSTAALRGKLVDADTIGKTLAVPSPEAYGHRSSLNFPRVNETIARALLDRFLKSGGDVERYKDQRDFPARDGTSRLSPHLRAGTIGIRECVERTFARAQECGGAARANIETWIGELIWRDFYHMVLKRFPHVATASFIEAGDRIPWRDSPENFVAWCAGQTGYPIVDAAMRQLNGCGWMHNRLRMIVASFLTKDLLIDWRCGERYFETHLADADLASNNGGWQWAASTGTDAAPYFRIFNPIRQSKTFDPTGAFIRSMLPELRNVPDAYVHEAWTMPPLIQTAADCRIGVDYPTPIVDHDEARVRALGAFEPIMRRARQFSTPEDSRVILTTD